jgi:hypothetical protein
MPLAMGIYILPDSAIIIIWNRYNNLNAVAFLIEFIPFFAFFTNLLTVFDLVIVPFTMRVDVFPYSAMVFFWNLYANLHAVAL